MATRPRSYPPFIAIAGLLMALLIGAASASGAAGDPAARALAERYAPIVLLKAQSGECDTNGEAFGPSPVNPLLGNPAIALERDGGEVRHAWLLRIDKPQREGHLPALHGVVRRQSGQPVDAPAR